MTAAERARKLAIAKENLQKAEESIKIVILKLNRGDHLKRERTIENTLFAIRAALTEVSDCWLEAEKKGTPRKRINATGNGEGGEDDPSVA